MMNRDRSRCVVVATIEMEKKEEFVFEDFRFFFELRVATFDFTKHLQRPLKKADFAIFRGFMFLRNLDLQVPKLSN